MKVSVEIVSAGLVGAVARESTILVGVVVEIGCCAFEGDGM